MHKTTVVIITLLFCAPYLLSGDAPNYDDLGDTGAPERSIKRGDGEFYARVLHEHDVHNVDIYEVEVKVVPATGNWPGVSITNGTIKETNIHTLIRLRGLSVPIDHASRLRPHVTVEKEHDFFVGAMEFVWKVLSAHEYLILANPVLLESPAGSGAMVTECDAYLEVGGVRISLADTIIFAGHADAGTAGDYDWGKRQVPKK